eukprot:s832_g23.t1
MFGRVSEFNRILLLGSKCLETLLGQPFVQPRFVRQFRERLLIALEAQGFDDHQWVEPLWRLNDAHGSLAVFRFV